MGRLIATLVPLGLVTALAVAAPAGAASDLDGLVTFQSPSKNVGCVMTKTFVRCDIRTRDWKPPKKPESCDLDWGQGLNIDATGKGVFICAGDTTLGQGKKLAYGKSKTRGRFTCKSLTTGMRCTNTRNKHGFQLSRQKYRRF
jgi:Family of unknown function (DUF6636)